ncbi:hypothetical protein BC343_29775 [Mucilaginibacter pedocola]|uniref:Uncharacterized protein n=2 Tax=Mucilaginibacter pedocola TaxID=1792845 RepID=A0A1S9PDH2_9SPHI|nr:hypothetical protein BC343_29775 [Mucilaginibacter pedocola]
MLFASARAEIINGTANFSFKPGGPVFVALKEGMEVECGLLENGRYKISFTVKITKQQYEGTMKKVAKLYTADNKFIGIALVDIPVSSSVAGTYGGVNGPEEYDMEIFGYVTKANIKTGSIPENALETVLKNKAGKLHFDMLKPFLMKQRYEKMDLINKPYRH